MKPADRQNIFEICDELNGKGQKPTLDRVRQALGGGSFTTIQPLLKEWKEKRSAEPKAEAAVAPDDIKELLGSLAAQIWNKAQTKAGEELRALREAMQGRLDEVEQEKLDATLEVERLETENLALTEKLTVAAVETGDYKKALHQARVELDVQNRQLIEAEALIKRHEKLLLDVGELKGRLAVALESRSKP